MASSKRGKSSARWVVLIGSGVAAASFFVAIINEPHSATANPQPSSVVSSASNPSEFFDDGVGTPLNPGFSQRNSFQPPSIAVRPRLRSRGS